MPRKNASNGILDLARKKWSSSGLTDEHARKLRFRALNAAQVKALAAKFHEAGALFLPYFDLRGKPTKFYRIRYLERLPGAAGVVEKPQRYDQLPVLQDVYYPPLLPMKWEELASDPKLSTCITEGELKAACACTLGLPTMALGGVYSFMSSKRGIDWLPSLDKFEWKERKIYIVYDNDLNAKPQVMIAQRRLADALNARGGMVYFVTLPPGPDKGLDDFLVARGKEAFLQLIEKAEPYQEAKALWSMNEEVVFIKKIDTVIERKSGLLMEPNRFMHHVYANRFFMEQIEKGKGKNKHVVLEKTKLAPKWMEWEQRSELFDVTYAPGQPKVYDDRWNLWNGWGVTPKKGSVDEWHWLLDFLFVNDDKARRYFEQWCAYPIQNPGAKLYVACVLWSRVKRLGKSMIGIALKYIYGENARFVESRELKSGFNTWAKNRQLVIGEEITAGEARVDADYLKYIITSPHFTINEKYQPEIVIPNHTNFLFLSNHPDAIFLEDGDKRYLIHGIAQSAPAERKKYDWVDKWLHGSGPSHLMHYFLDMDLKGFNPREHAPETTSKYEMIITGKNDYGLWVQRLLEDPTTALKALGQTPSEQCDLFTPEQLYHACDPNGRSRGSLSSLGKQLASAGFRQVNQAIPVSTASGLHRLYAVRNFVLWDQATRREIKEHYDKFFGPKTEGKIK